MSDTVELTAVPIDQEYFDTLFLEDRATADVVQKLVSNMSNEERRSPTITNRTPLPRGSSHTGHFSRIPRPGQATRMVQQQFTNRPPLTTVTTDSSESRQPSRIAKYIPIKTTQAVHESGGTPKVSIHEKTRQVQNLTNKPPISVTRSNADRRIPQKTVTKVPPLSASSVINKIPPSSTDRNMRRIPQPIDRRSIARYDERKEDVSQLDCPATPFIANEQNTLESPSSDLKDSNQRDGELPSVKIFSASCVAKEEPIRSFTSQKKYISSCNLKQNNNREDSLEPPIPQQLPTPSQIPNKSSDVPRTRSQLPHYPQCNNSYSDPKKFNRVPNISTRQDMIDLQRKKPTRKSAPQPTMPTIPASPPLNNIFRLSSHSKHSPLFSDYPRSNIYPFPRSQSTPRYTQIKLASPELTSKSRNPYDNIRLGVTSQAGSVFRRNLSSQSALVTQSRSASKTAGGIPTYRFGPTNRTIPGNFSNTGIYVNNNRIIEEDTKSFNGVKAMEHPQFPETKATTKYSSDICFNKSVCY